MVRTKAIYLRKKAEKLRQQLAARPHIQGSARRQHQAAQQRQQQGDDTHLMSLKTMLAQPAEEKTEGPATVTKFRALEEQNDGPSLAEIRRARKAIEEYLMKRPIICTRNGKRVPYHLIGKQWAYRTGGKPIPKGE